MCCTRLAGNTGRKNDAKSRHMRTIVQLCQVESSQLHVRHVSTIGKKVSKQQYLLYMSAQYDEHRSISGWDRFGSLGHPSKCQRVSSLGLVTAAMSLTRGQPNFTRCLAVCWAATLYMHFRRLLPLTKFRRVQNSRCVQVLRSPILAALLHGIPAAGSAKLCGVAQGIMELSQRASPIFGWAAITLGIGPHSSYGRPME